jgi:hypothetical protein
MPLIFRRRSGRIVIGRHGLAKEFPSAKVPEPPGKTATNGDDWGLLSFEPIGESQSAIEK